jgi:hypothetical protein
MPMIGVLFDIEKLELKSGMYGYAAYKILFEAVDTRRIAGCSLLDGDTQATLEGSANHYCIALDFADPTQIAMIENALDNLNEPALLPPVSRYLDEALARREPLVRTADIDSEGKIINCNTFWVLQAWKESQSKRPL